MYKASLFFSKCILFFFQMFRVEGIIEFLAFHVFWRVCVGMRHDDELIRSFPFMG